jgi:hypothetical protein
MKTAQSSKPPYLDLAVHLPLPQFFQTWCAKAKFGLPNDRLQSACGQYAAGLVPSIESFPTKLAMVANRLSKFDKGPFPLIHGDFGHNNIVVNDGYQIIGVIDWEKAYAAPLGVCWGFPLNTVNCSTRHGRTVEL